MATKFSSITLKVLLLFGFMGACTFLNQTKNKDVMEKQGNLEVTVVNAEKQPLADVSVSIAQSPRPVADLAALTNDEGVFSFNGLDFGIYSFRLFYGENEYVKKVQLNKKEQRETFVLDD